MDHSLKYSTTAKLNLVHSSLNSGRSMNDRNAASANEIFKRDTRIYEKHKNVTGSRDFASEQIDDEFATISPPMTFSSSGSAAAPSSYVIAENRSISIMRRYMISLHRHTAGREPDAKTIEEINRFVQIEADKKNISNEIRWMEKLKIHLIKQGKEKESKRVVELYQKLKGMSVVKNREGIIGLMYGLFDKEQTRAIIAAKATSKKLELEITETPECGQSHPLHGSKLRGVDTCRNGKSSYVNVKIRNKGTDLDVRSHSIAAERPRVEFQQDDYHKRQQEIDHTPTPIPNLNSSFDNTLKQDLNSNTKVPSLIKRYHEICPRYEGNSEKDEVHTRPETSHKKFNHSDLDSVSKISKINDERSHHLLTSASQESFITSTPNVFSSTPMDIGGSSRLKQFVSLRKPEMKGVSLESNTSSFKSVAGGTTQIFANSKSMERNLIRDIVFILQGIDGTYIKLSPKGTYEIITKQYVHPAVKLQTLKLCEMGYCYIKIRNYCEKSTTGLMAQGFKHAIEKELQEFYRLLAVIQSRIQQTIVDTPMSENLSNNKIGDMSMLKLGIWLFECRPRLQVLSGMVESCDSKRGGSLCSAIHKYLHHGDMLVSNLTVSLLSTICKPLYIMLSQWILYGELEDPFNEFFIAADVTCKKEQLWRLKYRIRSEMLPSFVSIKQAEKILAIGKNINFLKEICNNVDGFEGKYEIKALLESGEVECLFLDENSSIQYAIEMSYKSTSEKVLKVLIEDSKLLDHLNAIKKYLLLGQGDFIQYFLELIQEELSKPASKLYNHNISAILESAVRATNAQFENEDILTRLDTRILPTSDKDLGWDVFCLDYKAHGPIGTVLTEDVMNCYNKLFNSLWRTKRIEIILSTLWKNQTVLFKYLRLIPELAPVLHRSQLLISELIHFVHQTQYYIMFEATECAWEGLMDDVNKSSDLDGMITAHQKFLDTIFKRSLLDIESRDLLNQLRGIFDSVYELRGFLNEFNGRVESEVNYRRNLEPNTAEVLNAQRQFFATFVMQAKGKIETLYTTTQDLVRTFLLVLNRQQDLTLQCLSFRLDFNEYYHHKDSRLSQPLTFQHRRRSSNAFTPLNVSSSFTGITNSPLGTSMSIPEATEDFTI